MNEMKSLTLNGVKYDSFTDETALKAESKVTVIDQTATDNQIPSAKAVYDAVLAGGGDVAKNAVLYTEQELTEEQQAQARDNVGAVSAAEVEILIDSKLSAITNAEEVAY